MNDIKQITNAKKYIESFDRFFISFSAVKNASLADFLVQYLLSLNLPPRSIIFNRQTYSNLEKSGLLVKFTPLKDKGILVDKVFGTDYVSAVKGLYEKQKRYKILLFTLDEAEGREFEKLDMIDNRINDIDAVGFDNNGNFFQYLYKLPKEDVVFKVKANKPAEALQVVFFKTEVNGSLTPLYPKTDPRVVAKKSGDTFSYAIDKNELFESDKVLFILKISGKELVSDYNDFYFGDKQAWYLNVNPDRIFAHNNKQDFDEEIKTEVTQKPADIDVDTSVPDSEKFNYYGDIKNPKQISLPTDTPIKSVINLTDYQKIEGTKLKSDRGVTITVGKYIAKGGEGFVYFSSQPGMVIKLFNDGLRTRNKKEKIEFMTKKRITHPCIAWPQDSLYDSGGNFVGYQMMAVKTAKGMGDFEKMCKNQVFMNSVKKTSLAAAAASISSTMEYLHQRNVVLGDIKLENFAIKEDDYLKGDFSHIIFVDCDSYQLDKFPCTVFSEGYVSPESKVELFSKFYRPIQYDQFSLFVLLFKLFFRRVLPYTRIRKESEPEETRDEAARSGIFPYYLSDDGSTEKIAPLNGGCSMIWSHLPRYVKQAFIDAGDKKTGKNYHPLKRKSAGEWHKIFKCYYNDLISGKLKADKDYDVGYPKEKCAYKLVDIDMIRELKENVAKVSLRSAVKVALVKAGIQPDENLINKLAKEVSYKGSYKDNNIQIRLIRYLGVYCEIEFVYQG